MRGRLVGRPRAKQGLPEKPAALALAFGLPAPNHEDKEFRGGGPRPAAPRADSLTGSKPLHCPGSA